MGAAARRNPFNRWRQESAVTSTKLYDRFRHEIHEGDLVHLLGRSDVMWRVQKCAPALAPNAPPGMVELQLVAVFALGLPGGQPITDMVKVQGVEELREAQAKVVES